MYSRRHGLWAVAVRERQSATLRDITTEEPGKVINHIPAGDTSATVQSPASPYAYAQRCWWQIGAINHILLIHRHQHPAT